jgi:hypothetical protein
VPGCTQQNMPAAAVGIDSKASGMLMQVMITLQERLQLHSCTLETCSSHVLAVQVESGALPGNSALPGDIKPVQPPNQQDNNTVGLVVGLVVAGVVVGCLGALLVMLLRHRHNRRKWPGGQLKQQAAAEQALVRHASGASSNGSGKQGCAQHTNCPGTTAPSVSRSCALYAVECRVKATASAIADMGCAVP